MAASKLYEGTNLYNPDGKKPTGLGQLDPDDLNLFNTQRRQARQQYDLGTAQNQYRRDTANIDYSANQQNLLEQYRQARNSWGSDLIQRGLLNSGIYRQQYGYLQDARNRGLADLHRQHQAQLEGLKLSDDQLASVQRWGLDDIASAEAARRASVAAALEQAKQIG